MLHSLFSVIGSNKFMKVVGLGDSVWAILIGFIIANVMCCITDKVPAPLKSVLVTEFYIKISVVLLCSNVIVFKEVGAKSLLVGWLDTALVMLVAFLFASFVLKIDYKSSIISAGGLSVCGSSAATAICSAVGGNSKTSNQIIAIMSLFTVPVIPLLSLSAKFSGLDPRIAGAWIGGCVDSTGAVIATATLVSPEALKYAAVFKMIQNLAIGPLCLILSIAATRRFNPKILWDSFPKFVLGFLVLSGVMTAIPIEQSVHLQANTFALSEWFSTCGFVCIGLELNMKKSWNELKGDGKLFILAYLFGQGIDILSTLGWSYLIYLFM